MKKHCAMLGLLVAACGPVPQTEQSRVAAEPAFGFKNLKAGLPLADAEQMKIVESCTEPLSEKSLTCQLVDRSLGDVPIIQSYVIFEKGKFDTMFADVHASWFDTTVQSLTSAYGEPCRLDSKQLQNAYGATFSGDELVWCFKDGELTFRRHSESDVRRSMLAFTVFKPAQPVKQFTPDTL
jgi:hypothetical protein